jgi:Zn-dependent protease
VPDQRARGGLLIARVVGVPILLMPSWFLFAAYIVLSGQSLLRDQVGGGRAYAAAVAFVFLLLVSVVLHELGHCLVARAFGLPVRSITVTLLAGLTEITEQPQTPAREYAVAISGPMVSLLLAAVGVAAVPLFDPGSLPRLLCQGVAVTNGAIAALNLLPGLPLDGGRVLRSVLWHLSKDPERATRASARAGMVIALVVVPVVVVGILPAVGVGNRGVGTILLSALVGAFIYAGAAASLRRSKVLGKLPQVSVAALARPALAVAPTLPLGEAVRLAHEQGLRALVVVDGNGRLEGVVSEAWVRQVPIERRPWVLVADGARRVEPGLLLEPGLFGEALLEVMRATPASEYVVPGPQPRVLVSSDVAAAMQT